MTLLVLQRPYLSGGPFPLQVTWTPEPVELSRLPPVTRSRVPHPQTMPQSPSQETYCSRKPGMDSPLDGLPLEKRLCFYSSIFFCSGELKLQNSQGDLQTIFQEYGPNVCSHTCLRIRRHICPALSHITWLCITGKGWISAAWLCSHL
jgi:hypothetical protein